MGMQCLAWLCSCYRHPRNLFRELLCWRRHLEAGEGMTRGRLC